MPRYLVQDFFRERPGAAGAAGGTAQFYLASGVPVGPSATTDVDGKFNLLDEVYPGLGYYTVTKAGVTKKHDMRSVGFIGTVSAADIVTFFQGFATNGILKSVLSEFAISAGGGLNISVAPGGGVIAGHPFRFSSAQSRASATAHVSLPRIDRMVASLVPPGAAVGSPGAITIKVVGGVAAASPAAPALVNTTDEIQINLGTWTVAAGATAPSSLIPEAVRSIPGTHAHPMTDVTGLTAALAAKAPIDSPSFTGNAVFTTDGDPGLLIQKGNGTDLVWFSMPYNAMVFANGASLVFYASGITGETFRIDGVSGNVVVGGVTLVPAELARLDGVSSNVQTQLDAKAAASHSHTTANITGLDSALAAKAPLASPAFTGTATGAFSGPILTQNFQHNTGSWGFNGMTFAGKYAEPADISSGTVDVTWGSQEVTVLTDVRAAVNQILACLKAVGMMEP